MLVVKVNSVKVLVSFSSRMVKSTLSASRFSYGESSTDMYALKVIEFLESCISALNDSELSESRCESSIE